jgi:hypothetical protein
MSNLKDIARELLKPFKLTFYEVKKRKTSRLWNTDDRGEQQTIFWSIYQKVTERSSLWRGERKMKKGIS